MERAETGLGKNPLRELPHAERTIPALLEMQARHYEPKTLLRVGEVSKSYKEMPESVGRLAGALANLGVERGDRVAVLSHNRMEMLELFLACAWMGAIFVPLNTALRGVQLTHQLRDSGSSVLVTDASLEENLHTVEDSLPELECLVFLDGGEGSFGGLQVEPLTIPKQPVEPASVAPSDLCAILYTSGTTGPPKGVCCPQAQSFWWGIHASEHLNTTAEDTLYTCAYLCSTQTHSTRLCKPSVRVLPTCWDEVSLLLGFGRKHARRRRA